MKRFKIKNNKNGLEFQLEANALTMQPEYGKPKRTLKESDAILQGEDLAAAIDSEEREEMGELVNYVTLPAEYTIVEEDITGLREQEQLNAQSLAYLASTDWLIIREQETGVACPQDVREARAAARAQIVRS